MVGLRSTSRKKIVNSPRSAYADIAHFEDKEDYVNETCQPGTSPDFWARMENPFGFIGNMAFNGLNS
jgi:hypothetical protein